MQAVAGQLFWRHIIADLAAGCALGQQVSDEVPELLVGSGHMWTAMEQCRQVAAVMLVDNQRGNWGVCAVVYACRNSAEVA